MEINFKFINRLLMYAFGLLLLAIGSNLSIATNLGVSPINSIPYVISVITEIPLGIVVPIVHSSIVIIQAIILKKDFKIYYLLEVVFVMIFGSFIGLTGFITTFIIPQSIFAKIFLMIISLFFIALGVSFYVSTNILNMPIEAVAIALNEKYPNVHFHNFKMYIDCTFVAISIILSLVFNGHLIGIGIGTVVSAICVGKIIPYTNKISKPLINKICF